MQNNRNQLISILIDEHSAFRVAVQLFSATSAWQYLGEGEEDDEAYSLVPRIISTGTLTTDATLFQFNHPYLYGVTFHPIYMPRTTNKTTANQRNWFAKLANENLAKILSYLTENDLAQGLTLTCTFMREAVQSSIILHYNIDSFSSNISAIVEKSKVAYVQRAAKSAAAKAPSRNFRPDSPVDEDEFIDAAINPAFSLLARVKAQAGVHRASLAESCGMLGNAVLSGLNSRVRERIRTLTDAQMENLSRIDKALVHLNATVPDVAMRLLVLKACLETRANLMTNLVRVSQIIRAAKSISQQGEKANIMLLTMLKAATKLEEFLMPAATAAGRNRNNIAFSFASLHHLKRLTSRFHHMFTGVQALILLAQEHFPLPRTEFIPCAHELYQALKCLMGQSTTENSSVYGIFVSCNRAIAALDSALTLCYDGLRHAHEDNLDTSFFKRSIAILSSHIGLKCDVARELALARVAVADCMTWLLPVDTITAAGQGLFAYARDEELGELKRFMDSFLTCFHKDELDAKILAEVAIAATLLETQAIGEKAALHAQSRDVQVSSGKKFDAARATVAFVLGDAKAVSTVKNTRMDEVTLALGGVNVKERKGELANALSERFANVLQNMGNGNDKVEEEEVAEDKNESPRRQRAPAPPPPPSPPSLSTATTSSPQSPQNANNNVGSSSSKFPHSTVKPWHVSHFACENGIWSELATAMADDGEDMVYDASDIILTKDMIAKLFSRGPDVSRSKALVAKRGMKHFTAEDFHGSNGSRLLQGESVEDLNKTRKFLSKFGETIHGSSVGSSSIKVSPAPPSSSSDTETKRESSSASPTSTVGLVLSYERLLELKQSDRTAFIGLRPEALESYLSNDEFMKIMGMDREAFARLPLWKRIDAKKKVGLF